MGFVKLNDNLKKWAWYHDNDTLAVYVRLLEEAVWGDTYFEDMHLKRGQLVIKQEEFAKMCGLTRQRLRTILERLVVTRKITRTPTTKNSIISILDYDCLSNEATGSQAAINQQPTNLPIIIHTTDIQTSKQQPRASRGSANSNPVLEASFNRFWEAYPRKTAKQQAFKAWAKLNPDSELVERIIAAIERQKQSDQWKRDNGQFIPYPTTWLNGGRWEDEVQTAVNPISNGNNNDNPPEKESFFIRALMKAGVNLDD